MSARPMFRAVLATQWKWSRLWVLFSVVLCFALPLLAVGNAGDPRLGFSDPRVLLASMGLFGAWYALLSGLNGLLIASLAWSSDHAGRHVYALSLPVPRWYYVLLRFGAGALLALLPAIALWLGAMLAVSVADLPVGLQAYPHAIGLRFALASLVAFALFFGVGATTPRAAGIALVLVLLLVSADIALSIARVSDQTLFSRFIDATVRWPGVFEIFTSRWMLIDV